MKKNFVLSMLLIGGFSLIAPACGSGNKQSDDAAVKSPNHSDENDGNHANTPPAAPGTEYPGSSQTGSNTIKDTL